MTDSERDNQVRQESAAVVPHADVPPKPRKLRDLVELYMKSRLPRNLHPSYDAIRQIESASARPALPATSQTEPVLRSASSQISSPRDRPDLAGNIPTHEIYQEADDETCVFKASLKEYEEYADPKYKTDVTLEGVNHTWEEVLSEVNAIADHYQDKSGFWAKVRVGLRKCGDKSERFAGWLELLPSDSEYFSVVCGGLKLILKAAARLGNVRKSVFDAIIDIPNYLTTTKVIGDIFQHSKKLHELSSALYVATLAALDHIVFWFRQNAAKKISKAFINQGSYEEDLTNKIKTIQSTADRFAKEAQTCSYQRQVEIQSDIKEIKSDGQVHAFQIERSRSENAQNYHSLKDSIRLEADETRSSIRFEASETNLRLMKLESQNAQQNAESTAKLIAEFKAEREAVTAETLKNLLTANPRLNPKTHDLRDSFNRGKTLRTRAARREKVQAEVLEHLDYEHSVLAKDIESLLRIAWLLPKPAQDRAVTLMKLPKLHEWLGTSSSSVLFVNGNFDTSAFRSPLSFVCAKLMDSLQPSDGPPRSRRVLAHAFFCGQHLDSEDPDGGISGLMRSLVAQLVNCGYDKFEKSTMAELLKIDPSDVHALCDIYYDLITQLSPYTTVFCVIDALSFHEDSQKRTKEALLVMKVLNRLTRADDSSEQCIFKALLTCPGASRNLHKEVNPSKNVIWMPSKVSAQGGFTSMKWSASVGREVGVLHTVNSS